MENHITARRFFGIALGFAAFAAAVATVIRLKGDIASHPLYVLVAISLFGGMLLWWRLLPRHTGIRYAIVVALVVRAAFIVWYPPSDDINRYIWEGSIQNEEHNPFLTSPSSTELKHLRDQNWTGINHKDISTIYWPTAQLLFRATASISKSPLAFKTLFVLFDLATALVLILYLRRFGVDRRHSFLYLLNPVPILFIAGEGHLESIPVFFTVLALYLFVRGRAAPAFLSLGFAVTAKPVPILLLPFLINRSTFRYVPLFLIPFGLMLFYNIDLGELLSVPVLFAREFSHNGLFFSLASLWFPEGRIIATAAAAVLYVSVFFLTPDSTRAAGLAAGIFILSTPTFHPWYLLLITPFLVLYRSPAWLTFHFTVLFAAFYFHPAAEDTLWQNRAFIMTIEYLPVAAVGFFTLLKPKHHWPRHYPTVHTVSAVIPTLNEEKRIERCIQSILQQDPVREILVVDGGSTDQTTRLAGRHRRVTVLHQSGGRGMQIRKGIEKADADVVLVVHADSIIKEGVVEQAVALLNRYPDHAGGAFGAKYDNTQSSFRFTEILNDFRARVFGISFGDQAQFFRRSLISKELPWICLMEDVEISFRMKGKGAVGYIPHGVLSSTRMWRKTGFMGNFVKVVTLTAFYIIRRRFGLLSKDNREFYRWYYRKNPA